MTANDLLAAFETLADAPDGVAHLRELVLDLAIRGKLVPQIAAEITGPASKGATAPPHAGTRHWEAPPGWDWIRLGEVGASRAGDSIPEAIKADIYSKVVVGRPYIATKDVGYGRDELRYSNGVRIPIDEPRFKVARPGAVLVCSEGGSAGRKVGFVREEVCYGNKLIAVQAHGRVLPMFLFYFCQSEFFRAEFRSRMTGIIGGIAIGRLVEIDFPLPPLAEQHRIVARVDELMGLLDRLEAARTTRDEVRRAARDAALAALRDAEDSDAVEAAWGRIARQMDALFAEPEDVGPLRDVILDLAVGGRLVPQEPIDDPAERLVDRSTAEMQRRHMAGLTRIGEDPGGYDRTEPLPGGWCWCSLQRLVQFIDYRGNTPTKVSSGVRLITAKNIRRGFINRQPEEFVTEETYREWMTRGFPQPGDVLFTTEAPMGNAALVDLDGPFALAQRTINLQPYAGVSGAFLVSLFLSPWFQAELTKRATGMTATGIKAAKLRQIRVPVPPLAEQHRIVAKVDALMALCDALEARLTTARDLHAQFAAAAVHHLDV